MHDLAFKIKNVQKFHPGICLWPSDRLTSSSRNVTTTSNALNSPSFNLELNSTQVVGLSFPGDHESCTHLQNWFQVYACGWFVGRQAYPAFQHYSPHVFYPRLFLSSLKTSLLMTVYRETRGKRLSTPGFAAVSLECTNPLFACGRSFCTPRYPGRSGWVPRCRVRSEL